MDNGKTYLKLNDIDAYKASFHLSNYVWDIVLSWENNIARRTIREQFIRASDSISANIAEGFGRFFKKDKVKFYYYSKGSLEECLDWNEKAKARTLIADDQYNYILKELLELPLKINTLIKYTNEKLSK